MIRGPIKDPSRERMIALSQRLHPWLERYVLVASSTHDTIVLGALDQTFSSTVLTRLVEHSQAVVFATVVLVLASREPSFSFC